MQGKQTVNLEDLVQDKEEINFLFKLKNQIMMSLLNKHRVKIPGLGTVELYDVKAGNRFMSAIKRFKLHVVMDENLKIKLENQRGKV
jgi:hypothetical protein